MDASLPPDLEWLGDRRARAVAFNPFRERCRLGVRQRSAAAAIGPAHVGVVERQEDAIRHRQGARASEGRLALAAIGSAIGATNELVERQAGIATEVRGARAGALVGRSDEMLEIVERVAG